MSEEDIKHMDESDEDFINYTKDTIGYFIAYDKLFSTWLKRGDEFDVSDVRIALSAFNRLICKSRPRRPPCTEFQLQPAGDSAPPYRRLAPPCGIQTALVFSLPEPA